MPLFIHIILTVFLSFFLTMSAQFAWIALLGCCCFTILCIDGTQGSTIAAPVPIGNNTTPNVVPPSNNNTTTQEESSKKEEEEAPTGDDAWATDAIGPIIITVAMCVTLLTLACFANKYNRLYYNKRGVPAKSNL